MTAPRAFLIPTDWGRRPLGRLELIEDGPFQVAGAASPMTAQRELVSGIPFVSSGTVDRERDYIGWRVGYSNMAGFYWPGGTGTIIARAARFVAGQINYYFGGCLCNDTSVTVSSGNFTMNNSTTGSFGIFGGTICATSQFDPAANPYFVAKSIQSTRADMAAYNHSGRLLKAFSRTGISGQTFSAGQVTSCYFGGPNSAQSRNGTLTEMVVLVGGLQLEELHAVVSQFYGLFFRPAVERTFFVPASGGSSQIIAATLDSLSLADNAATPRLGVAAAGDALVLAEQASTPRLTVRSGVDGLALGDLASTLRLTVRAGSDSLAVAEPAAIIALGAVIVVQASTDALVITPGGAALRLSAQAVADALVLAERQATIATSDGDTVASASLDYWVMGQRLQWSAQGAAAHYTMPPARCHFDA